MVIALVKTFNTHEEAQKLYDYITALPFYPMIKDYVPEMKVFNNSFIIPFDLSGVLGPMVGIMIQGFIA